MTRAVIYARYSSDLQRAESITVQVHACSEYCRLRGYSVVREYVDEAPTAYLQLPHAPTYVAR